MKLKLSPADKESLLVILAIAIGIAAIVFFNRNQHQTRVYLENPGQGNDIRPNLIKALDGARDGDTIVFPRGVFKSGTCTIKKKLYFIGTDSTVLNNLKP